MVSNNVRTLFALTICVTLSCAALTGCGGDKSGGAAARAEDIPKAVQNTNPRPGPAPMAVIAEVLDSEHLRVAIRGWLRGDYNADGVINGADVFPLALRFDTMIGDEDFDECVDGNGDWILNGLDLFTIAANFGQRNDGYNVRHAMDQAGPFEQLLLESPLGYVPCGDLSESVVSMPDADFDWVEARTWDSVSPSESDGLAAKLSWIAPPEWTTTTGIGDVELVDGFIKVYFNSATSPHSPPVRYWISWDEESPIPFDQGTGEIQIDWPDESPTEFDYEVTLYPPDDQKTLYFNVQAEDSANPHNRETNTVELPLAIPDIRTPYEPEIRLVLPAGPGALTIFWTPVEDRPIGTPPVLYNLYVDTENPIPHDAGTISIEEITGEPAHGGLLSHTVTGLEERELHYVGMSAQDSVDPPNVIPWYGVYDALTTDWNFEHAAYGRLAELSIAPDDTPWLVSLSVNGQDRFDLQAGEMSTGAWDVLPAIQSDMTAPPWRCPPKLRFTPLGDPVLLYSDTLYHGFRAESGGGAWTPLAIRQANQTALDAELDSSGNTAFVWVDQDGWLTFTELEGESWVDGQVAEAEEPYVDLALDSAGNPWLVWIPQDFTYPLMTAFRVGSNWNIETLEDATGSRWHRPVIETADDGTPVVAWISEQDVMIRVAVHNGSKWVVHEIEPPSGVAPEALDLAVSSAEKWAVLYVAGELEYESLLRLAEYTAGEIDTSSVGRCCGMDGVSLAYDSAGELRLLAHSGLDTSDAGYGICHGTRE